MNVIMFLYKNASYIQSLVIPRSALRRRVVSNFVLKTNLMALIRVVGNCDEKYYNSLGKISILNSTIGCKVY